MDDKERRKIKRNRDRARRRASGDPCWRKSKTWHKLKDVGIVTCTDTNAVQEVS